MANWDHKSNIGTHPGHLEGTAPHNGLSQVGGSTRPVIADVDDTHIPVGSLVTVTIGRNVAAESIHASFPNGDAFRHMRLDIWHDFRAIVTTVLRGVSDTVFGPFDGVGEWEGISEQSSTFTAITNAPISPDDFERQLGKVASWYDQDAIAWSYGPARLAVRR